MSYKLPNKIHVALMLHTRVILSFNDGINIYLHDFRYRGNDIVSFNLTVFKEKELISYGTKYMYKLSRGIKPFLEQELRENFIPEFNFCNTIRIKEFLNE